MIGRPSLLHPLWTSTEATVVTGGRSSDDWQASGVSINVNDIRAGDLFLASADDKLIDVVERGAAAVAVSGSGINSDTQHALPVPVMSIGNAFMALQNLADAARFRTHAYVIGAQGAEARMAISGLLAKNGQVHNGGRHVSLGLANLPEDADYAVFGISPLIRPDIVVITSPSTSYRDTLFETMSAGGAVLINNDDEAYLSIVARAKAAGIDNIVTYGVNAHADIRLSGFLEADNGVRLSMVLYGMEQSIIIDPACMPADPSWVLCAAGILQLTGRCIHGLSDVNIDVQEDSNVTLFDKVAVHKPRAAIMRIHNLIDLGTGQQTAVLKDMFGGKRTTAANAPLSLPKEVNNVNIVHTGRKIKTVQSPRAAIAACYGQKNINQVTSDVLAPGDFLVFREIWNSSRTLFSEALRYPDNKKRKTHAV